MPDLRAMVSVWESACADLMTLARDVGDDQWLMPTDLPGWSARDVLAHCAALESELAGVPPLRVEIDKSLPHVDSPASVYTERGVVGRRDRTIAELIDEFEDAVNERRRLLAAEPLDDSAGTPPITPGRIPWDWATLLRNRPIDIWVHEQDIRRAVGRPGGLDSPAAQHTQAVFAAALPYVVAKVAGAAPGSAVIVDVTGPVSGYYGVTVDADGRGHRADPATLDSALRITLDTESFTLLGAGRRDPATLPIGVDGDDGDDALADRVLRGLNLTF